MIQRPQVPLPRRFVGPSPSWLLIAWLVASAPAALAEAYRPTSDAQVLERLPRTAARQSDELAALRQAVEAAPGDPGPAARLARHYIELGRAAGEPRFLGYAQAALAPWWGDAEAPPEVLLLRATLRQSDHRFAEALADLDLLLRRQPRNAQAWLTRAVVQQVRGDYAAALASCEPLRRLAPPLLAAGCASSAASLQGQARQSYALLAEALRADPQAAPATRRWALTGLAEIAQRLGEVERAGAHFEAALEVGDPDPYLLGAYADFLLDRGRDREARRLLARQRATDDLLLRLALAERRLGSPRAAALVEDLRARFAAVGLRGENRHAATEARFLLELEGRPGDALRLAQANWSEQKEPADAWLLLASSLAAGEPAAGEPVVRWVEAKGLEDVRLAALIERWRGEA